MKQSTELPVIQMSDVMFNCSRYKLHTRVTLVCVDLQVTALELEVVLGNDLVECVSTTGEVLADTAVAVTVSAIMNVKSVCHSHQRT